MSSQQVAFVSRNGAAIKSFLSQKDGACMYYSDFFILH